MGTGALSSALNPSFFNKPLLAGSSPFSQGFEGLKNLLHEATSLPTLADAKDTYGADAGQAVNEQFEGLVYRSQVEKMSLSLSYQDIAARIANSGADGESSAEISAQQLSFQFFAESRSEELVRFGSRTGSVAEGLPEEQRGSYVEASRQVAQRFSFSLKISGAALEGFAGASEKLQQADDADGIDQLVKLANDALGQADDVLDKIFDLLGDFFSNSEGDFQTKFNKLYEGLSSLGLFGSDEGTGLPAAGSGAGSTGTAQFRASSINIQMEFSFESTEITQVQQSDPLVLDLDNDGIELTSHTNGARFDIRGNGQSATTAFVNGGDAFLAIDRNGNGKIDSGRELFGDQNGAANGFEELRKYDSNGDDIIDANDTDFAKLRLFRDNGNGKTEAGELQTLAQAGINQIDLRYSNVNESASGGNKIAQRAKFSYLDGRQGLAGDALLNFTA